LEDSYKILNSKINAYLYELIGKNFNLFATPKGRKPVGHKESARIIALSRNGRNYYPSHERLQQPIAIRIGNKLLYKFTYC
jgi:hypothetical protein